MGIADMRWVRSDTHSKIIIKIKTGSLALALGIGLLAGIGVIVITICVNDHQTSTLKRSPSYKKLTWSGDEHARPVFTSPTMDTATNNLTARNTSP